MNKVYCYCCCYSIRCSMLHFPCCTQLCRFIVLSNMYSYNPVSLCLTQGAIHSVVHVGQIQQAIHAFHSVSPKVLFFQLSMLVRFNKLFMCFILSHPRCLVNCPCWSDSTSYLCVSLSLTQGIQYNTTLLSLHREICLSGRFQLFHLITQPACCVICPILSVNHSLFSILAFTSSDTRYHSRFSILAFASSDTRYHSLFSILVFASSDAR